AAPGTYELTLVAAGSGIKSVNNNIALIADATDSWITSLAASIEAVTSPRTTPVGQVVIDFNAPVTGVDLSDFTLTRNAQIVPLGGVTLIGSGDTYGLDLANVTTLDGTYVLTLVSSGSGIADAANDALTIDASDTFSIDSSAPIASIGAVAPSPRTTPV